MSSGTFWVAAAAGLFFTFVSRVAFFSLPY